MKAEPGAGEVEARPIADFAPAVTSRRVNFLKIDVEGFELHGELYCSTSDDSVSCYQQAATIDERFSEPVLLVQGSRQRIGSSAARRRPRLTVRLRQMQLQQQVMTLGQTCLRVCSTSLLSLVHHADGRWRTTTPRMEQEFSQRWRTITDLSHGASASLTRLIMAGQFFKDAHPAIVAVTGARTFFCPSIPVLISQHLADVCSQFDRFASLE
jgi:hypothetical protein